MAGINDEVSCAYNNNASTGMKVALDLLVEDSVELSVVLYSLTSFR